MTTVEVRSIKAEGAMSDVQVRFDDGAAYDRTMGKWRHLAGGVFLAWVAP
jgi:hypothetical protein